MEGDEYEQLAGGVRLWAVLPIFPPTKDFPPVLGGG